MGWHEQTYYFCRYRILDWIPLSLWVHKFCCPDPFPEPHKHPNWFVTLPLQGYWEQVFSGPDAIGPFTVRYVRPWRLNFRRPGLWHRVIRPQRQWPVYTVCLLGPRPCAGCARRREQFWRWWNGLRNK